MTRKKSKIRDYDKPLLLSYNEARRLQEILKILDGSDLLNTEKELLELNANLGKRLHKMIKEFEDAEARLREMTIRAKANAFWVENPSGNSERIKPGTGRGAHPEIPCPSVDHVKKLISKTRKKKLRKNKGKS